MLFDDYDAVQFHNLGIGLELGDINHDALIADYWTSPGPPEHLSFGSLNGRLDNSFALPRSEGDFALDSLDLHLSQHINGPVLLFANGGNGIVVPLNLDSDDPTNQDRLATVKSGTTAYNEGSEDGGNYIDANGNGQYDSGEPLLVTATRTDDSSTLINLWSIGNGIDDAPDGPIMDGGGYNPDFLDDAAIDIVVNIDRPLTDSEEAALQNLQETINAITAAINALPDDAVLTLPNGANVTGAELKAIWSVTDFSIHDNITFDNGSVGGEARMHYGEPSIGFNIQYLDSYDNLPGGMNYLVAHELGHLSQAGTSYYTDQRTANDIARALLDGAGLEYFSDPGYGYTPTAPMEFSVPSTGGNGDGGGLGGGDDGGCGGDGGWDQTCW